MTKANNLSAPRANMNARSSGKKHAVMASRLAKPTVACVATPAVCVTAPILFKSSWKEDDYSAFGEFCVETPVSTSDVYEFEDVPMHEFDMEFERKVVTFNDVPVFHGSSVDEFLGVPVEDIKISVEPIPALDVGTMEEPIGDPTVVEQPEPVGSVPIGLEEFSVNMSLLDMLLKMFDDPPVNTDDLIMAANGDEPSMKRIIDVLLRDDSVKPQMFNWAKVTHPNPSGRETDDEEKEEEPSGFRVPLTHGINKEVKKTITSLQESIEGFSTAFQEAGKMFQSGFEEVKASKSPLVTGDVNVTFTASPFLQTALFLIGGFAAFYGAMYFENKLLKAILAMAGLAATAIAGGPLIMEYYQGFVTGLQETIWKNKPKDDGLFDPEAPTVGGASESKADSGDVFLPDVKPQGFVESLRMVITPVFAWMHYSLTGRPDASGVEKFFHTLKDIKRVDDGVGFTFEYIVGVIQKMGQWFGKYLGLDPDGYYPYPGLLKVHKRTREIIDGLYTNALVPTRDLAVESMLLTSELSTYMSSLKGGPELETAKRLLRELETLKLIMNNQFSFRDSKEKCHALFLSGPPGTGKSVLSRAIYESVAARVLEGDAEKSYYADKSSQLYILNPDLEFFDDFNNQPFCLMDDINIYKDVGAGFAGTEPSVKHVMHIVNEVPYLLPMADLFRKGRYYANFRGVFMTANQMKFNHETMRSLTEPGAFGRRVDAFFVTVNELYCKLLPDGSAPDPIKRMVDKNRVPKEKIDGILEDTYDFSIYDIYALDVSTGVPDYGKKYTLDELVDRTTAAINANKKSVKVLSRSLEKRHEAEFAKKIADLKANGQMARALELERINNKRVGAIKPQMLSEPEEMPTYEKPEARRIYAAYNLAEMETDAEFKIRFFKTAGAFGVIGITEDMISKSIAANELYYGMPQIQLDIHVANIANFTLLKMRNAVDKAVVTCLSYTVLTAVALLCGGYLVNAMFFKSSVEPEMQSLNHTKDSAKQAKHHPRPKSKPIVYGDRSIAPQASRGLSDMHREQIERLKKNVFSVSFGDGPVTGYAIALGKRRFVMPHHFVDFFRDKAEVNPDVRMHLRKITSGTWEGLNITYKALEPCLQSPAHCLYDGRHLDRVYMEFPREMMAELPDITKFIPNGDHPIRNEKKIQAALLLPPRGLFGWFDWGCVAEVRKGHLSYTNYYVLDAYYYSVQTKDGDCGAPLFGWDDTRVYLMGMHTFGNGFGTAGAIPIPPQELKAQMSTNPYAGVKPVEGEELEHMEKKAGVGAVIGKLARPHKPPTRTELVKTKLHGVMGPLEMAPARLAPFRDPEGVVKDPLTVAHERYGGHYGIVNPNLMADIVASEVAFLLDHGCASEHILSFDEANHGYSTLKGIPRSTSLGFDTWWMPKEATVGPGKRGILGPGGNNPEDLRGDAYETVRDVVDDMLASINMGYSPVSPYVDFPKDELRPEDKVLSGATRLISGAPYSRIVIGRMVYGDFMSHVTDPAWKIRNGHAVGFNPYTDAGLLYHWHSTMEGSLNGDFKAFDCTNNPQFMRASYQVFDECYIDPEKERKVREWVASCNVESVHVDRDALIRWFLSQCSGDLLTMILNGTSNRMMHKVALVTYVLGLTGKSVEDYERGDVNIQELEKDFTLTVMGDDSLLSVKGILRGITTRDIALALAPYGLKYTNGDKSDAITNPVGIRPVMEMAFLKRGFRRERGRIVAPLELDSIRKMIYWSDEGIASTEFEQNVQLAMLELSFHGEEVFNKYAPAIIKEAKKMDLPVPIKDWLPCFAAASRLERVYST